VRAGKRTASGRAHSARDALLRLAAECDVSCGYCTSPNRIRPFDPSTGLNLSGKVFTRAYVRFAVKKLNGSKAPVPKKWLRPDVGPHVVSCPKCGGSGLAPSALSKRLRAIAGALSGVERE